MAGERYLIATAENNFQITIRNILNPRGFCFLDNCHDSAVLMRLIRSYSPDFVVVDLGSHMKEVRGVIEAIDDELICTCILMGDEGEIEDFDILDKSRILSYCYKNRQKELLAYSVELGIFNYKRISRLEKKLKEMTETYETRKAVDKAKWILMNRHNICENDAYQRIRKKSMDTRLTMRAIADAIICTYEIEKG